ncbi:28S ribosomal protein S14, mitochondrial [Bagarius yarrelli]|uniref:Calcyclin-binding protein n=1 Tax=Bagarius yarrelli TaxID=175774 RepID=A0A556U2Y9_BAGYA|nr:28S ribosomal protein S14, mitochondrial [Bagarius yarrelli]
MATKAIARDCRPIHGWYQSYRNCGPGPCGAAVHSSRSLGQGRGDLQALSTLPLCLDFAPGIACRSSLGIVEQVRGYYVDWRMLRDVKRRQMAYEYADTRLRINAIRKNALLPKELKEVADKEIAALPRDSCPIAGLESDLKEVTRLLDMCERKRMQDVLSKERKNIEKELTQKLQQREQQAKSDSGDKTNTTGRGYTVKINNYGWDQSDTYVKVYITLKQVHKIPADNVQVNFTDSKPAYDENADPGEGLMNMLKKIYSEGDDEIKRTINKAWAESQEKKAKGDEFDF